MPVVTASSFADLADVRAYKQAIANGKTEQQAFAVGDNGVGAWGDVTATRLKPMCALPPEDWKARWGNGHNARGKKVSVTYKNKTVVGELRDTMPHKKNITNGAGIDLNPAFAEAFGLRAPFMVHDVRWEWAD